MVRQIKTVRLRRPAARPAGRPAAPTAAQAVQALRRLRSRAERERTGTCYVEGVGLVGHALRADVPVTLGVIAPATLPSSGEEAARALRATGAPVVELSPEQFSSISFKENLQGIGAVVQPRVLQLDEVRLEDTPDALGWVALSEVGNAGNLGAVLRSCDAVGCAGVILLDATADPFHPDALRASRGTTFALRVARASFAEFAAWKRSRGYTVAGTSPGAERDYRDVRYATPLILLMGSERLGLSPEQQAICDVLARIPMAGHADSLNLAVAASVVLYEIFDQHRRRAAVGDAG